MRLTLLRCLFVYGTLGFVLCPGLGSELLVTPKIAYYGAEPQVDELAQIQQLADAKWQSNLSGIDPFKRGQSLWLRIQIPVAAQYDWVRLSSENLNKADLYTVDAKGRLLKHFKSGRHRHLNERAHKSSFTLLPLEQQVSLHWLRIESIGSAAVLKIRFYCMFTYSFIYKMGTM